MIPLGVLAARRPAGGGGGDVALVQFKSANANATSVTLDAAPTAGNLLVIGGGCASDPTGFSHGATQDILLSHQGWRSFLASAVVAGGASATVSVTGMSNTPRLAVWEFSGVSSLSDSDSFGGNLEFTAPLNLTSGLVAVAFAQISANAYIYPATNLTNDFDAGFTVRHLAGSSLEPTQPLNAAFNWDTGRGVSAVICGYS